MSRHCSIVRPTKNDLGGILVISLGFFAPNNLFPCFVGERSIPDCHCEDSSVKGILVNVFAGNVYLLLILYFNI